MHSYATKQGILTRCPCIGHLAFPSIQQHCRPKVCYLSSAVSCEENVLGFNISVDNTLCVEIRQACYNVPEVGPGYLRVIVHDSS